MKQQISGLLKQRGDFREIQEIDDGLIAFSHFSDEKRISKIFIDFSFKELPGAASALQKQRSIVEPEFFRAEGTLQWNFYYYYVVDQSQFENLDNREDIKLIERDSNFSRKRVMTLDALRVHYPFDSIVRNIGSNVGSLRDLSNDWIDVLRAHQLDEVYSDSSYDKAIENYLSGNPIIELQTNEESGLPVKQETPNRISSLTLTRFRKHKPKSHFDFSQINLIEGANGAGKTSTLEAIELLMCGRTLRQESLPTEDADIKLEYLGISEHEKFEPKNTRKFKDREQVWYGIPPAHRGNNLARSFNRFNYMNTDAGYRLSTDAEPSEIWKSFETLALGQRTTELAKRISGFEERFAAEKRKVTRDQNALTVDLDKDKKIADQLRSSKLSFSINYDLINSVRQQIGESTEPDLADTQILDAVRQKISSANTLVKSILAELSNDEMATLEFLNSDEKSTLDLQHKSSSFSSERSKLQQALNDQKKLIESRTKQLSLHERLRRFFDNEEALDIKRIEREISDGVDALTKVEFALSGLTQGYLVPSRSDGEEILKQISKLRAEIVESTRSRLEIETDIQKLKSSVDRIREIVVEAKSLGKLFLSVSSPVTKCPMCETSFDMREFENRVNQVSIDSANLSNLLESRASLDFALRENESELRILEKIVEVLNALGFSTPGILVGSAKLEAGRGFKLAKSLSSELQTKRAKLKSLHDQGFSTSELEILTAELQVSADSNGAIELSELNLKTNNEIEKASELAEKIELEISELVSKFLESSGEQARFSEPSNLISWILDKANRLSRVTAARKKLQTEYSISVTTDLRSLLVDVEGALAEIREYMSSSSQAEHNRKTLIQLETRIKEREVVIAQIHAREERADKALAAFKIIKENHSSERAAKTFFDRNKSVIVGIFRAIHFPNEFDDIEIDPKNNLFYVKSSSERRDLSRISTGQRSALAISIFLGMHLSCPSAPRVLIFDDPVAFVDDLNILAFLDFLRELAVTGERQVFIATANKKLASLIKRKFEMLESSFTSIAL